MSDMKGEEGCAECFVKTIYSLKYVYFIFFLWNARSGPYVTVCKSDLRAYLHIMNLYC